MKKINFKGAKKITKKQTKTTRQLVSKRRVKKYPAHHLAIVLVGLLVTESVLFGVATGSDWQSASQLLDVSLGFSEVRGDVSSAFQPMTDLLTDVNLFYQISAAQMARLLDLSGSDMGSEWEFVYGGVSEFYQQASIQMVQVLDISSVGPGLGQVAGISIGN